MHATSRPDARCKTAIFGWCRDTVAPPLPGPRSGKRRSRLRFNGYGPCELYFIVGFLISVIVSEVKIPLDLL